MDRPRHLVSAADVNRCLLNDLFALARSMEEVVRSRGSTDDLRGRVLATLFFEPSTRTRFSFEVAMMRLGGGVVGAENAREHSLGASLGASTACAWRWSAISRTGAPSTHCATC